MRIKVQFKTETDGKKHTEDFELLQDKLKVKDTDGKSDELDVNNIELIVFEGHQSGYIAGEKSN